MPLASASLYRFYECYLDLVESSAPLLPPSSTPFIHRGRSKTFSIAPARLWACTKHHFLSIIYKTRKSLSLAPPIPADYNDHSLDNNQERLKLQYVSPWQVELKPNPINFVFDTYSLHPYTSSQLIYVPEEARASASGSEGGDIETPRHILSNSTSTQSLSSSASSVSFKAPSQTSSVTHSPRAVEDEPSPKRQPQETALAPLVPSALGPSILLSSATRFTNSDPGTSASPNTQTLDKPSPLSPASSTSPKRRQSTWECSNCPQAFPKRHLLNRHNTAVHDKRFVCNVQGCDHQGSFRLKKDLTRHQNSRHPLLYPTAVNYHCIFAGCPYGPGSPKSFRRKDNRDRHVREH
ncbi:hypothetical protein BKA65DRAFT_575840 [Rhexocercosporidium sp. MPI-PUGE-AT-0058]|nr:hypothetical protein BKA65DRAFT_575840 [Rhexocercosporidium sp. MPI-PUGE-AT-0058]